MQRSSTSLSLPRATGPTPSTINFVSAMIHMDPMNFSTEFRAADKKSGSSQMKLTFLLSNHNLFIGSRKFNYYTSIKKLEKICILKREEK
jgi:hypothetical protein